MTINLCEFEIWVCQAGWYGPDCDQACWSNQCVNNMCHPESGLCLEYEQTCATPNCSECVAGRWGNNCLNTCESNCATGTCVKTAGKCFECKQGFSKHHTATCSPCSAFCNTGDCDKDSGKCIGGCVPGRYGDQCKSVCQSSNCLKNQCDKNSGLCLSCPTKYLGDLCQVCQAGWWGGQCEKSCHENCEPNTCDRYTGDCKGCVPGRYGDQCKFLCQSSNCLKNQCDKNSGLCLSCPTRYFGDLCQVCQAGWWGGQCEKSCHENCEPNTCDRYTGDCKDAHGKTTTQQEVYESDTDKLIVPVVGSILGVGLLLTISLTAAVCWINRGRRHSKFTDTDDNYYSTPDTVPLLDDTERRLPDLPSSSPSSGNNGNTEPKTIHTDTTGNDYTHSKTINTGNIGNDYTHLKTINTGNIGNNYSHLKTINTGNTDDDYTHPKTIQTDNTGNEYTRPKAVRTDNTYENKTQSNTVRTESPDRQGTQPKTSRTQGSSKQDTERTYEGHVYTAIDTDETTF
ncbi:scavenger receptor class F member 2-like [Littorina saxatilis]|uniref:scavenger receptor class F member 2-like n=1 Tax=Littorina saxatilis TaxID=31220 RepID=UPI0038B4FB90